MWSDLNAALCIPAAPAALFADEPSSLPVSAAQCGTSVFPSGAAAAAARATSYTSNHTYNVVAVQAGFYVTLLATVGQH